MTVPDELEPKRRNRNYEETHQLLIQKAVEIIAERGAGAMSMSALGRATGFNRTTIYYHFDSREALMAAVEESSARELGLNPEVSRWMGIDRISTLVLDNPDIITAWVDNYIVAGDFRTQYPQWDSLVTQIAKAFGELANNAPGDAEVLCDLLLTSAVTASRVFVHSVHPRDALENMMTRVFERAASQAA